MATITREEYKMRLRQYVTEQLTSLPEESKPKGIRASVEFNRQKAIEFNEQLIDEGYTIE